MTMLEPDWEQERPDSQAIEDLWSQPVFESTPLNSAALDNLLTELRTTNLNGNALFGRFGFPDNRILNWFISRNRFEEISFLEHLLTSDEFRRTLPALNAPETLAPIEWEWWSPYLLAGDWARVLMDGGAYTKYKKGGRSAMCLAERACADLFGDRFEEVVVFRTGSPWSEWFFDIAWDITWLGIDKREQAIWVLCLTDTD